MVLKVIVRVKLEHIRNRMVDHFGHLDFQNSLLIEAVCTVSGARNSAAHKCRYVQGLVIIGYTSWTLPATLNTDAQSRLGIIGPRHLPNAGRRAGPFPIHGRSFRARSDLADCLHISAATCGLWLPTTRIGVPACVCVLWLGAGVEVHMIAVGVRDRGIPLPPERIKRVLVRDIAGCRDKRVGGINIVRGFKLEGKRHDIVA